MHEVDYIRTLAALLAVLGAIGLGLWLVRRLDIPTLLSRRTGRASGLHGLLGQRPATRLDIAESRWIDQKTRALVLRWDGSEHLVLVAAAGATLIESRAAGPAAPEATS